MAKAKTVKVDTKKEAKQELFAALSNVLTDNLGYDLRSGDEYDGMKQFTLVVKGVAGKHDVQISLTTPKAGEDTYDYKLLTDEDAE